jgi:uncharacterized BrkB/YihY/UPF0761 family membrane protein
VAGARGLSRPRLSLGGYARGLADASGKHHLRLLTYAGIGLVGSVLIVSVAPRAAGGCALHVLLGIGRWVVAVGLLGLVVGLLVRYAPAERPRTRWASEGTLLILAVWVGASLLFRWYVGSVANFKTPSGQLTIVLVVTSYLFTTSLIFLLGVQLDELVRKRRER